MVLRTAFSLISINKKNLISVFSAFIIILYHELCNNFSYTNNHVIVVAKDKSTPNHDQSIFFLSLCKALSINTICFYLAKQIHDFFPLETLIRRTEKLLHTFNYC